MGDAYSFINEIMNYVSNMNTINLPIIGLKALACLILIITWTTKVGEGFINTGKPLEKTLQGGLSVSEILRGLILLAVLLSYDYIITGVEMLLSSISHEILMELKDEQDIENYIEGLQIPEENIVETIINRPFGVLEVIMNYINPFSPSGLFIRIFSVLDLVIFAFFLAKRGFKIVIWKLIFPIILVLSFIDKYKNTTSNYFKEGIRIFLVIFPFLVVNMFCAGIYKIILQPVGPFLSGTFVGIIVYIFIIILKISLFRVSERIVEKMIR